MCAMHEEQFRFWFLAKLMFWYIEMTPYTLLAVNWNHLQWFAWNTWFADRFRNYGFLGTPFWLVISSLVSIVLVKPRTWPLTMLFRDGRAAHIPGTIWWHAVENVTWRRRIRLPNRQIWDWWRSHDGRVLSPICLSPRTWKHRAGMSGVISFLTSPSYNLTKYKSWEKP